MTWLKQFAQSDSCVGVELSADHINIVWRNIRSGKLCKVASLYLEDQADPMKSASELIQNFVNENDLRKARCNLVLPASEYQLLLLERPEVADNELREAVKWKVKDLIQDPIESVAIDTFELPATATKGRPMIYVVVAPLQKLQAQIDAINSSSLELNVIDVDVFSLRNLISLKNIERSAAIVRLAENQGDVSIFKGNDLYLTRHFSLNYGGGLLDDLPSADLSLELQRSFDYFERQMGQSPPSVVFICGEGVGPEKINDDLKRSIAATVEYFDVSPDIGLDLNDGEQVDDGILQLCIAAIGATFRNEAA